MKKPLFSTCLHDGWVSVSRFRGANLLGGTLQTMKSSIGESRWEGASEVCEMSEGALRLLVGRTVGGASETWFPINLVFKKKTTTCAYRIPENSEVSTEKC